MSETIKVTLARAHTHAGRQHEAGDEISVTPPEAEWLAAHGVAKVISAADAAGGKPARGAGSKPKLNTTKENGNGK